MASIAALLMLALTGTVPARGEAERLQGISPQGHRAILDEHGDAGLAPMACVPPCDDGEPCTDDQCKGTLCLYVPILGPCDDADACTQNDFCSGGTCQPGPPVDCNDSNVCTDDSCDVSLGCIHTDNTNPCSDLDACSVGDTCAAGTCVSGPPLNCNDNNPCTDDACIPASGCTHIDGTPRVTLVIPRNASENQPVSTNVTIRFSEPVQSSTITSLTTRILDPDNGPVTGTRSVQPSGVHVSFDPAGPFMSFTQYTVQVNSGVRDLSGCPVTPFTSSFRVGTANPNGTPLPDVSQTTNPPPSASLAKAGSSVAGAGDLNGDGVPDLLVGAPGYQVGSDVEAGAGLVYLGSAVASELRSPDIIFTGASPDDRAGVSVAGSFDFNGDGTPDLLIGAEEFNRTATNRPGCAAGQPCGAGKVYLIYFNPTDSVHYPNLGNPLLADTVSLSLVGQPGGLPGVVFTGVALGDRAGFAVAGGGRANLGTGQDILIGAPGRDVGPHSDAGSAYLIFDSTQLLGSVPLGRVANGLADEVAGIIYTGASTGDALGFAVAFPGDITGTAGDDLALGAPFADASPVLPDAGIAYVAEGGNLATSTVDVSQLGVGVDGTQFTMDQAGAQLGFALAGGGDSQADGNRDFLMGSPGYTPENLEKSAEALDSAGAVFQTSARLGRGIVDVCRVGSAAADGIDGVTVTGARADDHLGSAVAGVSDVTGDGFDDIVLGAPNADPAGVADAGIAYLLDGASVPDARRGTISASEVGTTQAGIALAGTQVGETAGASLAGPGDLNGGGTSDVAVGAPGRDIALEQDAGTVYIVTRDDQDADGEPDISDCQPANGNVWRTPGEVRGDLLIKPPSSLAMTLSWSEPQPLGGTSAATTYTVAGGSRSDLPNLLNGNGDSCILAVTSATSVALPGAPPAGALGWFLVRAANACGVGSIGDATAGPRIQNTQSCDDGDPCTDDACSASGGCVHTNNTSPCNDGNACTVGDACAGGSCVGLLNCSDGNVCTNDTCNPGSGCVHTNNTLSCDDGNPCTLNDTCSGGTCAGSRPGISHLVISQFQHTGDGFDPNRDEFVELFNPTSSPIPLNGLSIQYKTGAGTSHIAFALPAQSIPARGWFLIGNTAYNGSPAPDVTETAFDIQSGGGGTLFLVNGISPLPTSSCSTSPSIIDKVGWGGTTCAEAAVTVNPATNSSKIRKPADVCGSGQDTNNNFDDFLTANPSMPHNRLTPPAP